MSATAIAELEAGPRTKEAVDAFFANHEFPIVVESSITFVWRGEAEAVHLKHWVFGLPSSQSLARVEGTDLWHLTLELPAESRVEYKLEIVRDGHGKWTRDPLNTKRARDPFGSNSVAHGTGYQIPTWIQPDPSAQPGHFDEITIDSKTLGRRGFGLYVPARFQRTRQYPLLVVHDGHEYLRYASLGAVLDTMRAGDGWTWEGRPWMSLGLGVQAGRDFKDYRLSGATFDDIRKGTWNPIERHWRRRLYSLLGQGKGRAQGLRRPRETDPDRVRGGGARRTR